MIAVAATASKSFSFPVIIPTSLFAADPIARGSAAGNITAASSTPMPSTTRSAGTAKQKWRSRNPDYPRQYRQSHPESVERNRQGQRRRDRKRRLQNLVKNNLAFDLKHSAAEVWLLGPQAENLAKNNLAFSQVLILPAVPPSPAAAAGS